MLEGDVKNIIFRMEYITWFTKRAEGKYNCSTFKDHLVNRLQNQKHCNDTRTYFILTMIIPFFLLFQHPI